MAKEHYGKFNLKVIPVPILNNADANQRYLVSLLEQLIGFSSQAETQAIFWIA